MAKASDSRLRALYDDKDPDGDPLGELSDIMGISKDNDTEGDISLDLERELFGVNDDDPLSSPAGSTSIADDYSDAAASLESELLAVLGGLNASTRDEDDGDAEPAAPAAPDASATDDLDSALDLAGDADLAELELADLDLGEIDAVDEETVDEAVVEAVAEELHLAADSGAGDEASDAELEALFADVMETSADDGAVIDDALDIIDEPADTGSGHDPLTVADEVELDAAAAAIPESADSRDFEDDVELANVLAAPHPEIEDSTEEADVPEEPVARFAARPSEPDPIADAFSDLADLDVPSFIGTSAGTKAAMAAVDALSDVAEESTGEASDDDDGFSQEAEPEPVADELDYDIAADDAADSVTFEVADGDEDDGLDIDLDDLASEDLAVEPVSGFSIEPDLSDDAYDADLTVEAEADAAPRELTVASYDRVTEAEPRDDDEAAFAELLARADSEMTDEDFEAAAAALDAEAVTHASAADDYDDDEAEFEALPDYEPAVEEDLPPEPQASADAEDDAADIAGDDVDIEAELAAFDEAVRAAGALDAGYDETADEEPLPDIDTLEVDETIAATADFDIPELLEDEEPVVAAGDDFEAEFAESLARYREESAARHEATEASAETPASEDDVFETLFERDLTRDIEAATAGMAGLGMSASASAADDTPYAGDDLQFDLMDDDLDEPIGIPPAETVTGRPASGRRGFMVASAVGALAIFGVAFAVGSSFFGGEDGPAETTLIKADSEPVKIKPENPGGTTVPNQDNAVYDRVAGTAEEQPAQEALITTAEEPVELPEQAAPEVPMQKAEDRLTPADTEDGASPTEAELALISPKRVRTLIVKPDGSLVERAEELAAAQAAPVMADTASSEALAAAQESGEAEVAALAPEPVALEEPQAEPQLVDVAIPTPRPDIEAETGAEADAAPADAAVETDTAAAEPAAEAEEPVPLTEVAATEEPAVPVRAVQSETIRPTTTDDAGTTRQVSRTVPVPSDRSADQPANVVGRTGSEQAQTAAAHPTPTPASGGYVVQIASLPSVAEAQSSFANLSARYGNLIGGRAMNIQRADIPGKGTFYRVRVAAQDRSDATSLCTRIKAAGGSCFVAR